MMKFIEMVVGSDRTPSWYGSRSNIIKEICNQFERGAISVEQLEIFVFLNKNPFSDKNKRGISLAETKRHSEYADLVGRFESARNGLNHKLTVDLIFLPQVQLFIEHRDPFDYKLLAEKIEFPSFLFVESREHRELFYREIFEMDKEKAINCCNTMSLDDFLSATEEGTSLSLDHDIVFVSMDTLHVMSGGNSGTEQIKTKMSGMKKDNKNSLWYLIEKTHMHYFPRHFTDVGSIPDPFEKRYFSIHSDLKNLFFARANKNIGELLKIFGR